MRDDYFVIREGDTASPIEAVLRDAAGDVVPLDPDDDVTFTMAPAAGGELVLDNVVASIEDPAGGRVRYSWQPGDTADAGLYLAEFRVNGEQTFPNDGAIVVAITARPGAITAGDLLALDENLEPARAAVVLELAYRAVRAFVEPALLPEPLPDRVELVVLRHALRLARATPDVGGAIVSESLGAYTYRLNRPLALDEALELAPDLQRQLAPWGTAKVYTLDATPDTRWPVDWWQRNYDHEDGPAVPLP